MSPVLSHYSRNAVVMSKQPTAPKPLKKTRKEIRFQEGLREAIQEMKDDLAGKRKMRSLEEALEEMRREANP